jgi:hypothetical protein
MGLCRRNGGLRHSLFPLCASPQCRSGTQARYPRIIVSAALLALFSALAWLALAVIDFGGWTLKVS